MLPDKLILTFIRLKVLSGSLKNNQQKVVVPAWNDVNCILNSSNLSADPDMKEVFFRKVI